jgi:hypothetical protein
MSELSDKLGQVIAIFDPLFEIPNDGYEIDGKLYEQEPEICLRKSRMEEVRPLAVEIRTLAIREGIDHLLPKSSGGETELGIPGCWDPAYSDEYRLYRAPKWIDSLRVTMSLAKEVDDTGWINLAEVARRCCVSKPTVGRWRDAGKLTTNNKKGTDCRVDPNCLKQLRDKRGNLYIAE